MHVPNLEDMLQAARVIGPYTHRTPVFTSTAIDRACGRNIFFKAENMQKTGSFKARGALNAVLSLDEESIKRGVATHSSGNHAAALAYAAGCRGTNCFVVMPENASAVKKAAAAAYGAEIVFCRPGQKYRESALQEVLERTGAVFVHPYNNYQVIAGQATAAVELLEQVRDLEVILAPVGGGGLLSGTALAAAHLGTAVSVFGAEPAAADDAYRSIQAGRIVPSENPQTIADGLRTSLGELTYRVIRQYVRDIVTVSEVAIVHAMRLVFERLKLVIEPSAAVPLAALLVEPFLPRCSKVGVIISGGNIDLDNLPWVEGR